ncbi:MAG: JAB domain-containing protein [Vicinamibacterales bacterium]
MNDATPMLRELTIRYAVKADHTGHPVLLGRALTSPHGAADLLQRVLGEEATEVFGLVLLSTRHTVVAYHEVSRGGLNTVAVEPRAVFTAALLANAAALIVAHVHPSGDPSPSPDDIALTRRLVAAGTLMGVEVLDHIIVGHGRYVSLKALGLL